MILSFANLWAKRTWFRKTTAEDNLNFSSRRSMCTEPDPQLETFQISIQYLEVEDSTHLTEAVGMYAPVKYTHVLRFIRLVQS